MQDEAQVTLRMRRIGIRPQQNLQNLAPMPLARNVGQQREKLSALVAREFDRPVIRVPQAGSPKQCDLDSCHDRPRALVPTQASLTPAGDRLQTLSGMCLTLA